MSQLSGPVIDRAAQSPVMAGVKDMLEIDPTPDPTLIELRALIQQSSAGRSVAHGNSHGREPLANGPIKLMANNLFNALREAQPDHPLLQEYEGVWWRQA